MEMICLIRVSWERGGEGAGEGHREVDNNSGERSSGQGGHLLCWGGEGLERGIHQNLEEMTH